MNRLATISLLLLCSCGRLPPADPTRFEIKMVYRDGGICLITDTKTGAEYLGRYQGGFIKLEKQ